MFKPFVYGVSGSHPSAHHDAALLHRSQVYAFAFLKIDKYSIERAHMCVYIYIYIGLNTYRNI